MAIKGSLKEASLPDVLQLLSMGKKSGLPQPSRTARASATSTSTRGASATRRS
jgi:hypothetical protein